MRRILAFMVLLLMAVLITVASGQMTDSTSMIIRSGDATDPWKPCWVHGLWGNPVGDPEAKWTWPTFKVQNPEGGETQIYTRKFNIEGIPNSAELIITADNSHTATLNGQRLGSGNWYGLAYAYDLLGKLVEGENTLTVEVKNDPAPGGTPESNPAGLLYSLVVSWTGAGDLSTSGEDAKKDFAERCKEECKKRPAAEGSQLESRQNWNGKYEDYPYCSCVCDTGYDFDITGRYCVKAETLNKNRCQSECEARNAKWDEIEGPYCNCKCPPGYDWEYWGKYCVPIQASSSDADYSAYPTESSNPQETQVAGLQDEGAQNEIQELCFEDPETGEIICPDSYGQYST